MDFKGCDLPRAHCPFCIEVQDCMDKIKKPRTAENEAVFVHNIVEQHLARFEKSHVISGRDLKEMLEYEYSKGIEEGRKQILVEDLKRLEGRRK